MSCYLHVNAESTNQCESCGVDLCNDCSTRFEELKCANCMKKAIMVRRIRYAIGLVVAIIVWLYIFYGTMPHEHDQVKSIFATIAALLAFSLAHGLSDYRSAMQTPMIQKGLQKNAENFKKGIASAKGEQFVNAMLSMFLDICLAIIVYFFIVILGIVSFALGSFFRRTILLVKEFKVDTSL